MQRVMIVGANRGIGLELAKIYQTRGSEVTAVCRKSSDELDALGVQVIDEVDISRETGQAKLKEEWDGRPIDVLIHNAGIMRKEGIDELDHKTIEEQLWVNAVGAVRTFYTLRECLSAGSKVGFMSSRMGSIEDNTSGGAYGYRMSKAALNAAARSLSVDLKDEGIPVAILHPGFVKTSMTGFNGNLSPEEAAEGLVERMDELNMENTGQFFHSSGERLPW